MTKKLLTDMTIKNLPPAAAQYDVFDEQVPNFGIRVSPGGTKTFVLFYRTNGKKSRVALGRYPIVKLRQARLQAVELAGKIAAGHDPRADRLSSRQSQEDWSFGTIVDAYIERYAKKNTKSWQETQRWLNREFVARWQTVRVQKVSKTMVVKAIDDIREQNGPSAANHAFAALRHFCNWCVERSYIDLSPCHGLKQPAKIKSRQRVLTDEELAAIWKACDDIGYPFGPFVKLLILTGQRRSEIANLCWSDLDLEGGVWTQTTNKSDRMHLLPLSTQAIAILKSMPRWTSDCVFPAKGKDRPMSGFSKFKKRLDALCGVEDWTLHDLRRTTATKMARLKIPGETIELVLNHQSHRLRGLAGVYNRYQYTDEKADALQQVADHFEAVLLTPATSDQ